MLVSMNGHATFNPNGATSSIDNLKKSGCITGVSYASPGVYQVSLSSPPAGYGVIGGVTTDSGWPAVAVNPASSQTPTGFQLVTVAVNVNGAPGTDFEQVTVQVL
jgi:hypothetical protein